MRAKLLQPISHHQRATHLRKVSNTNSLEKALRYAVGILAFFNIPHFVCGGYAVQERGYPRFTEDVDLIVPDVPQAREKLCMNGFKENPGSTMTITHRKSGVEIALLPGGGCVGPGPVLLPVPTVVSEEPQLLTLGALITAKLSSYIGNGIRRIQDAADVVKLIEANSLPRNFEVDKKVESKYYELWDEMESKLSPGKSEK